MVRKIKIKQKTKRLKVPVQMTIEFIVEVEVPADLNEHTEKPDDHYPIFNKVQDAVADVCTAIKSTKAITVDGTEVSLTPSASGHFVTNGLFIDWKL